MRKYGVLFGVFLFAACREKVDVPADSGLPAMQLMLIDHVALTGERMTDRRFRAQLYAELATADHTAHAVEAKDRVAALLERAAKNADAVASGEEKDLALEKVAAAHAVAGYIDRGLELAQRIASPKLRSRATAELAGITARARNVDRAVAIAGTIGDPSERSAAYAAVARALAEHGDLARAMEVQKKCTVEEHANEALAAIAKENARNGKLLFAEQAADKISSAHFRGEVHEAIARHHFEKRNHERADRIIVRIESSWLQSRAYAQGARIARMRGQKSSADALDEKALQVAEGINDKVMRASALEDLARLAIEDGEVPRGLELAKRAASRDVAHKITAMAAAVLADSGRISEAGQLSRSLIDDPLWGSDALGAIAVAQASKGDVDSALEVIATITTLELRLPPLARVAVRAGKVPDSAVSSVERILEAAPKGSSP
jgi:hypothetical protein